MTIAMHPIYTQTISAQTVSVISFNNVPQNFTDLFVVASTRSATTAGGGRIRLSFNGNATSIYSTTLIWGSGSSVGSFRENPAANAISSPQSLSTDTANSFTNLQVYIPSYRSNRFKAFMSEGLKENNSSAISTFEGMNLAANLFRSTDPITSVQIGSEGGNFAQNSTFTIYGITNGIA